ncbi:HD-GYP domain-containing protein [Sporosarcina highlanderae]|uniref:HD-GYP domain-containing protein n=1 Tax=Sporosarcina highlanderae TaxID=3035916 RepID=A0ABT8JUN9_9BACL|nr:HD-GYP domain-containing protein [Sporosarcina highlanderae]MDN4608886.1 HD-GYP domain-containing protein [Sporosarcina highlanderae]
MESIKNISELQAGTLLKEDVFSKTKYPIMRKETELTLEHIDVLRAFGVTQVRVLEGLEKNDETSSDSSATEDGNGKVPNSMHWLKDIYDKTVRDYKREFNYWRSGQLPDVAKIRSFIIPLLEKFIAQKRMLTFLNDFSTPEEYIYHHPIAVGILSAAIGQQMGYEKGDIIQLGLAGTLADSGMAKIAPSIVEKTAFLTPEEYNEVKKHTLFSVKMIQLSPLIRQDMKLAILQHHERLDGSGYPRGEKMETILVFSQILAVADVFHAMTSDRLYRPKHSPFKVIEMIKEDEFGKFDIKVVDALQNLVGSLSIGTRVKLTNGEFGEVMFLHRDAPLRPMIKKDSDGLIIDLSTNRDITIDSILE